MSQHKRQLLIVLVALITIVGGLLVCTGLVVATLRALDDGPAHRPSAWQEKRR